MRAHLHPTTRSTLLAATRGEVPAFDCLECSNGLYVAPFGAARPTCTVCGALCPDAIWSLMRELRAA